MQHNLIHNTDPDGREVVGVALTNHPERAWLYREDYERIINEFGMTVWCANHNGAGTWYVRLKDRKIRNNRQVARLVLSNEPATGMRYHDQNHFNLRRNNLWIDKGSGGTRHKRRWYPNEQTAQKFGLTARA